MPTLSLKKIFLAIAGIVVIRHLKIICDALRSLYTWISKGSESADNYSFAIMVAVVIALSIHLIVKPAASLKNSILIILGIITLWHLEVIFGVIESVYKWFGGSFTYLNNCDPGLRALM